MAILVWSHLTSSTWPDWKRISSTAIGMAVGVGSIVGLAVAMGIAVNAADRAGVAARSGFARTAISVGGAFASIAAAVGKANRAR